MTYSLKIPLISILVTLSAAVFSFDSNVCSREYEPEKLAQLRVEINDLDAQLRGLRNQKNIELTGMESRLTELELKRDAELLQVNALKGEIEGYNAKTAENVDAGIVLTEACLGAIKQLEALVKSGLPFHSAERLKALQQIRLGIIEKEVSPKEAAVDIWRFVEGEQQLASSVEMGNVKISLNVGDPRRLVSVVRLGMVSMYTRYGSNRYGAVLRNAVGAFAYKDIHDKETRQVLESLFSNVEKQMKGGQYMLPLFSEAAAR
jgi:hypothetical protein